MGPGTEINHLLQDDVSWALESTDVSAVPAVVVHGKAFWMVTRVTREGAHKRPKFNVGKTGHPQSFRGGNEEDKTRRPWAQDEGSEQSNHESLPRWKAQFTLQPLTEMRASQSDSMLVSMKAQEKECEEFLADQDNQMWKDMSEIKPAMFFMHEPMMRFTTAENGW